jgi:translation elongation factor P/translation initiation factor 5A
MADNLLATQLRKGMIVKVDNKLFRIFDRQHVTPGNLRGFVRVKMRNIQNGAMAEEKFRSEDIVERVSLEQKEMQYLYNDAEGYHFMDTSTYDQGHEPDQAGYARDGRRDPGPAVHRRRGRDSRQHGNGRISDPRLTPASVDLLIF